MKEFYGEYSEVGQYLTEGVAEGIETSSSSVIDAIVSTVKKAVGEARDVLDIHSPSRLMRDLIGKNMVLGMAEGITDNEEVPQHAIFDMNKKIISSIQFPTLPSFEFPTMPRLNDTGSMFDMLSDSLNSSGKEIVLNNNMYLDGELVYKNQQKTQYNRGYNFDMGAFWR